MRGPIVLGVLLVLIATACTQDTENRDQQDTSPTVSAAPTTTTTVAATTTTTVAATTSTEPDHIARRDWHFYAYQSVGYSCDPDPTAGCDGDTDMSLAEIWVGSDYHHPVDFIDFYLKRQHGVTDPNDPDDDLLHESGDADSEAFADSGWGVEIIQLESPPAGLDVSGAAWLELTVSSVSASEFAATPPQRTSPIKYKAPTSSPPVAIETDPDRTHLIDELVLAETTSDMMQWIVVLRHPGTYLYSAGYYLGGPPGLSNGLQILIRQN